MDKYEVVSSQPGKAEKYESIINRDDPNDAITRNWELSNQELIRSNENNIDFFIHTIDDINLGLKNKNLSREAIEIIFTITQTINNAMPTTEELYVYILLREKETLQVKSLEIDDHYHVEGFTSSTSNIDDILSIGMLDGHSIMMIKLPPQDKFIQITRGYPFEEFEIIHRPDTYYRLTDKFVIDSTEVFLFDYLGGDVNMESRVEEMHNPLIDKQEKELFEIIESSVVNDRKVLTIHNIAGESKIITEDRKVQSLFDPDDTLTYDDLISEPSLLGPIYSIFWSGIPMKITISSPREILRLAKLPSSRRFWTRILVDDVSTVQEEDVFELIFSYVYGTVVKITVEGKDIPFEPVHELVMTLAPPKLPTLTL